MEKIEISGVPNCTYYWEVCIVYTEFTNLVGDPQLSPKKDLWNVNEFHSILCYVQP